MTEQQGALAAIQDWFNKANQVNVPRTPYTAAALDGIYENPVGQWMDDKVRSPVQQWGQKTAGALNTAFPQATLLAGGADEMARRGKIVDQYSASDAIPVQSRPSAYPMSEIQAAPAVSAQTGATSPDPIMPTSVGVLADDLSRNASPDRFDPAVAMRGQRNAYEQPLLEQGYSPTNFNGVMYKTEGGQTTYQHPKGSITFQGGALGVPGRQGGGTLSVVGGRTPEEQAAIQQRVAEINGQTDALRRSKGKPTLAEEEQQNAMANWIERFATAPDNMTPQQMELWKLQQSQLANLLNQQTETEKYQRSASAARQEAALEQHRWEQEQLLRQQQAEQTGQRDSIDRARFIAEQRKENRSKPLDPRYFNLVMTKDAITQDPVFSPEKFMSQTGLQIVPKDGASFLVNRPYFNPKDQTVILKDAQGQDHRIPWMRYYESFINNMRQ